MGPAPQPGGARRNRSRAARHRPARRTLPGVLAALVAVACSSTPPPPPPPLPVVARVELRPLAQSPWSLPDQTAPERLAAPIPVHARVLRLERLLEQLDGGLSPLARSVLLVTDTQGEDPLLPSLSLVAMSFFARGETAMAWLARHPDLQPVDDRNLSVQPERVTRLVLEAHERGGEGSSGARRTPGTGLRLGVDLTPHGQAARLGLWVERPDAEDHERLREVANLDLELSPGSEPILLLVRWDQFDGGGDNLVLVLEPREVEGARTSVALDTSPSPARAARAAVLASIDRGQRRTALLESARLGANLTQDLLLQADDALFEDYRTGLLHQDGRDEALQSDGALSLYLERRTLLLLVGRSQQGVSEPWEEGLLLRHCGVAAAYPDVLAGAAQRARQPRELHAAFAQENLFALGSSNPAERLRGLRWLEQRDLTPEGYDPFAEAGERFAVLRAHEDAQREQRAREAAAEAARLDAEAAREGSKPGPAGPGETGPGETGTEPNAASDDPEPSAPDAPPLELEDADGDATPDDPAEDRDGGRR